jgi:hypothetical protein
MQHGRSGIDLVDIPPLSGETVLGDVAVRPVDAAHRAA